MPGLLDPAVLKKQADDYAAWQASQKNSQPAASPTLTPTSASPPAAKLPAVTPAAPQNSTSFGGMNFAPGGPNFGVKPDYTAVQKSATALDAGGINLGGLNSPKQVSAPAALSSNGYQGLNLGNAGGNGPKPNGGVVPGVGTGGPPPPITTAPPKVEGQQDISSLWADILKDHDAGRQGLFNQANADEAGAARRNAEVNAISGGGVGGAFAGGNAQVAIGGMQARQKALQDFNKQGVELKMARLEQLIKQAEAKGDRDLSRELQAEADKTAMTLKGLDVQGGTNDINSLANGG